MVITNIASTCVLCMKMIYKFDLRIFIQCLKDNEARMKKLTKRKEKAKRARIAHKQHRAQEQVTRYD